MEEKIIRGRTVWAIPGTTQLGRLEIAPDVYQGVIQALPIVNANL